MNIDEVGDAALFTEPRWKERRKRPFSLKWLILPVVVILVVLGIVLTRLIPL